jgi:hypothetical protein
LSFLHRSISSAFASPQREIRNREISLHSPDDEEDEAEAIHKRNASRKNASFLHLHRQSSSLKSGFFQHPSSDAELKLQRRGMNLNLAPEAQEHS